MITELLISTKEEEFYSDCDVTECISVKCIEECGIRIESYSPNRNANNPLSKYEIEKDEAIKMAKAILLALDV